jgi:hypothetical protein
MRHVIAKRGVFTSNPEVEMLLMLWVLLQMPTNCPDRPGRLRDYIELWDFDLDVSPTPDPKRFHVEITGGFNASGTA